MNKDGPDFICIGAQASGSSWLYQQLKEHPDFDLPDKKEIHYFDKKKSTQTSSVIKDNLRSMLKASDSLLDL